MANVSRERKLNSLRLTLERAIKANPGARDLAALSAQYRGVLAELEELAPVEETDPIEEIRSDM